MKLNKLSLDLLQYLRANLVFTFKFQPPEVRNMVTVSSPVDTDFEVFCLEQAVLLIQSMIDNKYPTTLDYDLQVLEILNLSNEEQKPAEEDSEDVVKIKEMILNKKNHWRFKLALIHRINQKEILHRQLKFVKILFKIMTHMKKVFDLLKKEDPNAKVSKQDFKRIYLHPVKEFGEHEDPQTLIKNRIIVRHYLQEYMLS